jgi:hypothetical protein
MPEILKMKLDSLAENINENQIWYLWLISKLKIESK